MKDGKFGMKESAKSQANKLKQFIEEEEYSKAVIQARYLIENIKQGVEK